MSAVNYQAFRHIQAIYARSSGREEKTAPWIGFCLILVALCFPGYESLIWLKTGVYCPLTITDAVGRFPITRFTLIDKSISWLTDAPLWTIPVSFAWLSFDWWTATH